MKTVTMHAPAAVALVPVAASAIALPAKTYVMKAAASTCSKPNRRCCSHVIDIAEQPAGA